MATLRTQGFQVGATERAPQIPPNIGKVDVRGIYDAVRSGLANFEAARQAPASMLLADVEAKEKTAQLPMRTAVLAETVKQGPIRTQALLAESTPEALQAKRDLAAMRSVKAPPPAVQVAQALAAAEESLAANPNDIRAKTLVDSLRLTQNKMGALSPVDPTAERATRERTEMAKLASREQSDADERQFKLDLQQNALAARQRDLERELESKETIALRQEENRINLANAKTDQQRAVAGAKAKGALDLGEKRNALFNDTVNRAVAALTGDKDKAPSQSKLPGAEIVKTLARVIGAYVPGTSAKDLESLIDTLKSEAGFKELEQMRLAAPGGQGASGLGQVTERELAFLQNRISNLRFSQSNEQLYQNIKNLQEAVNNAWKNVAAAYEYSYARPMTGVPQASTARAPRPSAVAPVAAISETPTPATAGPDEATTDMPQTPDQQFEVGKTYRDKDTGARAIFRGNGQWEEIQ